MHGAMILLSRGCEIRAGGYICRLFIIFTVMKNRGAYQDASRFSFYCKVPFLVQEMETVRVVEVISELERICEPVAEAYPVFPDFQLDLLVTFHAEELLSAVTSALVQENQKSEVPDTINI